MLGEEEVRFLGDDGDDEVVLGMLTPHHNTTADTFSQGGNSGEADREARQQPPNQTMPTATRRLSLRPPPVAQPAAVSQQQRSAVPPSNRESPMPVSMVPQTPTNPVPTSGHTLPVPPAGRHPTFPAAPPHHFDTGFKRPRPGSANPPTGGESPPPTDAAAAPKVHSQAKVPLPPAAPIQRYAINTPVDHKYAIMDSIGEGTYGSVYRGTLRQQPNHWVALKRLKVLRQLEGFPMTSVREIVIHKHLRSKLTAVDQARFSLLRDVEVSSELSDIYLVFDYVEHSLSGLAQRKFSFTKEDMAFVWLRVAQGLQVLHGCKIMHRDIKPNNVLIDRDGNIKICDFGLALPTDGDRPKLTPALIALAYRPPEMLLGSTKYTTAVDVWSLGCLLIHMHHQVPPFYEKGNEDEMAQLFRICDVLGPLAQLSPETRGSCPRFERVFQSASGATKQSSSFNARDRFHDWFYSRLRRVSASRVIECPASAVELLRRMLSMDPMARPTIDEVLGSNYLAVAARAAWHTQNALKQRLHTIASSHDGIIKREKEQKAAA